MKRDCHLMDSELALTFAKPSFSTRNIQDGDYVKLGKLLNLADLGTVDDPGVPEEASIEEIRTIVSGKYGDFLKDCSFLAFEGSKVVSAVLVTFYEKEGLPLIGITMTHPEYKNRGYCQGLLHLCLRELKKSGYESCFLSVNKKNVPAIKAYERVGFKIRSATK